MDGKKIVRWIVSALAGYSVVGTLTNEPTTNMYPLTTGSSSGVSGGVSAYPTEALGAAMGVATTTGGLTSTGASSKLIKSAFTSQEIDNYIMDEKAREAYNKYHKGNEKEMNDGTIVLTTPEAVRAFNEMMSSMSKKELYYRVCALLEILEEDKQKEEKKLRLK